MQNFFISEQDIQRIRDIGQFVGPHLPKLIEDFYVWMETTPEFSLFFPKGEQLAHTKKMQLTFWQQFFTAEVNDHYLQSRYRIGQTHARIGLGLDIYYRAVNVFNNLFAQLFTLLQLDTFPVLHTFQKLVSLDTAIVVDTYNTMVAETIHNQNKILNQLSTPVTRLWKGILVLPLIGVVDSHRAQNALATSLQQVADQQAKAFILDITGIAVVDTAVANHLIKITKATQLMGCKTIIAGVSPAVAQTIVELGIHTDDVQTTSSLQDALTSAFQLSGFQIHSQQK